MKRVGSMLEVTPAHQPVAENSYRCRVPGCQLPAAINDGSQSRICGTHFGMPDFAQNALVRKMRANPLLLEALLVTEATGEHAMRNLAEQMTVAGMGDLAPREETTLKHDGYGRHGEGLTVVRSEYQHPKLYMQRLRGTVGVV
ncbi:MAG: hypothetical protein WCO75_07440 [Planctomycetota bacterium]